MARSAALRSPARRRGTAKATACLSGLSGPASLTAPAGVQGRLLLREAHGHALPAAAAALGPSHLRLKEDGRRTSQRGVAKRSSLERFRGPPAHLSAGARPRRREGEALLLLSLSARQRFLPRAAAGHSAAGSRRRKDH